MKTLQLKYILLVLLLGGGVLSAQSRSEEIERLEQRKKALAVQFDVEIGKINMKIDSLRGLEELPSTEKQTVQKPASQSPKHLRVPGTAVRCTGMTQNNTRCHRNTTNASGRCWQHN